MGSWLLPLWSCLAGMVGDPGVGKTSLMVRYVEGRFDEDYVETLGVNFLEKVIKLPTAQVIMSLWDLGGKGRGRCSWSTAHGTVHGLLFLLAHQRRGRAAQSRRRALRPLLPGAKEFVSMMPMVCVDAVAMLFLFDLTNPSTLTSVREWYRQVRGLNKVREQSAISQSPTRTPGLRDVPVCSPRRAVLPPVVSAERHPAARGHKIRHFLHV